MRHAELIRSRCRGTLLGVAVGDALGAPFEGVPAVDEAALRGLERRSGLLRYTDDTHMTLAMAESLVECRGFDGAHMAATFARYFAAEPWRGYGAGPPQVFQLLSQGIAWDVAARRLFGGAGSFGNGAAMRVAPAALLGFRDVESVTRVAHSSALITHAHPVGMDGAALQGCAIALLLSRPPDEPLDPAAFARELRRYVTETVYLGKLDTVAALQSAGTRDEAVKLLGHSTAAHEAVPAALHAFLRRADARFADVAAYAISLGGDTDTIASMACALAGAYAGEQAIPEGWRQGVEDASRLRRLADDLLALATAGA